MTTELMAKTQNPSHRTHLAKLLKACRARLCPKQLGIAYSGRRRTPGLRREEVAVLADISVSWYTLLEQGREVEVSTDVLERISRALQMSNEERWHLFALAKNHPPPYLWQEDVEVPAFAQHMMDALDVPALIITRRWDVVAWNGMVTRIFRDYGALPPASRNLLRILLTWPEYQRDPQEYENNARRVVAKFRHDFGESGDDPAFHELIDELTQTCPIFPQLWNETEVIFHREGTNTIRHPEHGPISFQHTTYVVESVPSLRVVLFAPLEASDAEKVRILARQDKA